MGLRIGRKSVCWVELEDIPQSDVELEQKIISLTKYAYYNHIGSYHLIKEVGQKMKELRNKGLETTFPYIEIYGHWAKDESKLETEL